jgi:hypothetical protein
MLKKTSFSKSATTSARTKDSVRKRPSALVAPTTEIVNEPKAEWEHLQIAPFYCFSSGYIRSALDWSAALRAEVERSIEAQVKFASHNVPSLAGDCSFESHKRSPGAAIIAMGIQTSIRPGLMEVIPVLPGDDPFTFDPWDFDRWIISVSTDAEILNDSRWNEGYGPYKISAEQQVALRYHRQLLSWLFVSWKTHFAEVIRSGAAYIMARKNSVLSPFERVTWDQWQYFRLDHQPDKELRPRWGDPRHVSSSPWHRITATGPAGEKLYAIRVAPGSANSVLSLGDTDQNQVECLLVKLLTEYPDRPTKPLPELAKQFCSAFPGLSERAFRQCLLRAQQQTGNRKWSEAGRRSPRKPSHQT